MLLNNHRVTSFKNLVMVSLGYGISGQAFWHEKGEFLTGTGLPLALA